MVHKIPTAHKEEPALSHSGEDIDEMAESTSNVNEVKSTKRRNELLGNDSDESNRQLQTSTMEDKSNYVQPFSPKLSNHDLE